MGETYPFGLYTGEPGGVEILQRRAFHTMYGPNHLAIHKTCPACSSNEAEWIRNQWAICYSCELAFDAFERYDDLTVDEEFENEEFGGV